MAEDGRAPIVLRGHSMSSEAKDVIGSVSMDRDPGARTSCSTRDSGPSRPACPACGGRLVEIRMKLQCSVCRTICETCCEGGPG